MIMGDMPGHWDLEHFVLNTEKLRRSLGTCKQILEVALKPVPPKKKIEMTSVYGRRPRPPGSGTLYTEHRETSSQPRDM